MGGKYHSQASWQGRLTINLSRILTTVCVGTLLAGAFSPAQAAKGGNKAPKAEPDTGMFVLADDAYGFISDDFEDRGGYDHYCHGTDGYVYLVKRFTHGTGSQNQNGRTVWVAPLCDPQGNPGSCFGTDESLFEVHFLGTHRKANLDGTPFEDGERELRLRDMQRGQTWRATFNADLGKKRWLLYGYRGFADQAAWCGLPGETTSRPVWVHCHVDDGADPPRCIEWTVSNCNPFDPDEPCARACTVQVQKGKARLWSADVQADFSIELKYRGKEGGCPTEWLE